MAQLIKYLPSVQETKVQSLGRKDPLKKEMAPHSSILAWKIPGQRSLKGYHPWGCKSRKDAQTEHLSIYLYFSQTLHAFYGEERGRRRLKGAHSLYCLLALSFHLFFIIIFFTDWATREAHVVHCVIWNERWKGREDVILAF